MKSYQKPHLATYTPEDIKDQIGPMQADSVQFEIWRTGQLNKTQIKQYEIAKTYTDINSVVNSETV